MLPTTATLTNGERLRIARRRVGRTQEQWARKNNVSLRVYKDAESDKSGEGAKVRAPAIGKVRPHELCTVLRSRAGLTQGALARMLGVTKWWLCLMEQGQAPVRTLLTFWKRRRR